jgi:agmatinase
MEKIMTNYDIIKKISIKDADVVLLHVPYEGTISRGGGASRGPNAIAEMLRNQVELFDHILKKVTSENVKIGEKKLGISEGHSPEEMVREVEKHAHSVLSKGKFLATLGGEHTVSLGAISAAKKIHKDITVVQIDAHADLRHDNSDYEKNPDKINTLAHSAVMRRVYELGCPLVQIGIRSLSPMEYEFIKAEELGDSIFYAPLENSHKEIVSKCKNHKVYLTIDVDGFDPHLMPATGTPEPGGLSWDWGISFFRELFSSKDVIGLDIVEVAPRVDDQRTEFVAAKLLYHLIGLKFLS